MVQGMGFVESNLGFRMSGLVFRGEVKDTGCRVAC